MSASSPGPHLFSIALKDNEAVCRRRETFAASLLAQGALLALIIFFTTNVPVVPPSGGRSPDPQNTIVFFGTSGGGGTKGVLPASFGVIPRALRDLPIVPATVILPREMPKLSVEQSVMAPEVTMAPTGQIGDPHSQFSQWLSNGKGGPGGIGDKGCCDGVGDYTGPRGGDGPDGPYRAGSGGVSIPEPIYSPEPTFSEEARKAKFQGIVLLMLVVGKDGRTYHIHVRQSLGMGLDEQAIEAVKNWRFRPAILNGEPVASQLAVQVDFRLY